jgi:hypothetical protein
MKRFGTSRLTSLHEFYHKDSFVGFPSPAQRIFTRASKQNRNIGLLAQQLDVTPFFEFGESC